MAHYIHDEAAYEAATQARIRANARKGKNTRWLAEDDSRVALVEFLIANANGPRPSQFLCKMLDALNEWGTLTAGQESAVRKIIASDAERAATRAADRAARASTLQHVGTVGQRTVWTLTVAHVTGYESQFGFVTVHIFRDADGNRIVHKGTAMSVAKGDVVTFKATVKEHGERDGEKQTLLSRPTVQSVVRAE